MKRLYVALAVALCLWFVMFSPWTSPLVDFWTAMTLSALVLTGLACAFGGKPPVKPGLTEIGLGAAIAVLLWMVFWVGDKASQLLFAFARPQVDLIYGMKSGHSPLCISLLLLCIIGPAEEIFWRGYVQRTFSQRFTPDLGFLLATACYTLVHLPSMNFMLIMAAMVCGLAWGALYRLIPQHFTAIVVSHALWDAAAFVWFPF
ncbi:MAG: CPBP family intramembrane metalloprotease [Bacteroidaceae bacterium]|nr:CPBP family intramembrane metalloprotease [Bacteroidaceae bacterium]